MTDLDIQIDVPDDDDLGSSVRVLNSDGIPPWFKVVVAALAALLVLIMVGAFIAGRGRSEEDGQEPVETTATTTISSVEASPAIDMSLAAVEDWETFARTADLAAVEASFDPAGPQYALFAASAAQGEVAELDFDARNLVESSDGQATIVSLDLTVTGPNGEETFPYDMVYRPDETRVWTVVDRRSPGEVAVPPGQEVVDAASATWATFVAAVAAEDGAGVLAATSPDTATLADALVAGGAGAGVPTGLDAELEEVLLGRVTAAGADQPAAALLAILDPDQRRAITAGSLGTWTQVGTDRVVATLDLDGAQLTTVPFVAGADGWRFDLAGAMNATNATEG